MAIRRPRVRAVDGKEAALETYTLLQRADALPEACLGRMVRGISCRDYEGVIERRPVPKADRRKLEGKQTNEQQVRER